MYHPKSREEVTAMYNRSFELVTKCAELISKTKEAFLTLEDPSDCKHSGGRDFIISHGCLDCISKLEDDEDEPKIPELVLRARLPEHHTKLFGDKKEKTAIELGVSLGILEDAANHWMDPEGWAENQAYDLASDAAGYF